MHNYYNELNKIIELTKNNNNLISNLENNINLKEIIREIQKNISIFFDKNDAHFFFNIIYYEENSNEPLIKLINEIDNTYVYNIIFNSCLSFFFSSYILLSFNNVLYSFIVCGLFVVVIVVIVLLPNNSVSNSVSCVSIFEL